MEEINLPETVTRIYESDKIFAQCSNLIRVTAPGISIVPAPNSSGSGMFKECPKIKYISC